MLGMVSCWCPLAVRAATILYTGADTTTLGSWRTAAPDADSMYGTDGYVLFNYLNPVVAFGAPNPANDLVSLPSYITGYAITAAQGVDAQGTSGPALQDPSDVSVVQMAQLYNYSNGTDNVGPNGGSAQLTFTMGSDQIFALEVNAGHGSSPPPSWQQSISVSINSASATSSVAGVSAGTWQKFSVSASAGDVVTITANRADATGTIITGMAFDPVPVPEPGTLALLTTGLFGLLCFAWRRRR